ncbi:MULTISPECIES: glutamate-5-semialdehyde dehydrogenase [Gordonibacter]|uniref:Gamma-glutamyl phosphate reductase n=1 Tax=Gordonibacter faecis TaxID=3047475 RepID=A0ABT7DNL5_9ACTN|nr:MULTISPECIES: glutamate-5-semialdehyde dehydrogenase [unclassified Gordonibacter]MDJ1651128.1 glutamate-5-semialdehyde dehydrogenase [Gordonibacter sp. KGMB12511]HIW76569.1 glutamate-5-semialdehyde dehydrogenase [Candidatus Gordonibacter avicola]
MGEQEARAEVRRIAEAARAASGALGQTTRAERDGALRAMAAALRAHAGDIVAANEVDMEAARAAGTKESLLDRLMLNVSRVDAMATALEELAELPDPLGLVQEARTLDNGIELSRVSVPLGVVAVVYEARPNVTADAAGICLKSGNAAVLRGGSMAAHSNQTIAEVLHDAAVAAGLPAGCIGLVASTDRAAADELMQLHGTIDVLIPRGGAGLIRHCVECSKVPVIETGTGNCHVYVHASADLEKARAIIVNAKCRRLGVCNAAETLLVDAAVAEAFLPAALAELAERGITLHADERAAAVAAAHGIATVPATEDDWATEYLAPDLAMHVVDGVDEAIEHVNRYGTKHSEAIVAEDAAACEAFLARVDAAAVYANVSTAFTDGGQFGLGAEIGISTQKLHARGPFALAALTSYKYVLRGSGQVRP